MRIENMEQRVANTPAVLLCDECKNKDICKWADKMRDFVVTADKAKADTPFSYIPCCPHYGQSNETTQFQKDYAEEHPVYAYDLDHGIMTRNGYMPIREVPHDQTDKDNI